MRSTKEIKQTPLKIQLNDPDGHREGSINLKFLIMGRIRNHVQLIGNVGKEPTITNLDSGKKVARLSLATNERYKNDKGEKRIATNWHAVVAWGKVADIIENYVRKGNGVTGKLKSRSYTEPKAGNERYVTEVVADEILLFGGTTGNESVD